MSPIPGLRKPTATTDHPLHDVRRVGRHGQTSHFVYIDHRGDLPGQDPVKVVFATVGFEPVHMNLED